MEKEKIKFQKDLEIQKNKLIKEITAIDKEKMFGKDKKSKMTFFEKLTKVLYGKTR